MGKRSLSKLFSNKVKSRLKKSKLRWYIQVGICQGCKSWLLAAVPSFLSVKTPFLISLTVVRFYGRWRVVNLYPHTQWHHEKEQKWKVSRLFYLGYGIFFYQQKFNRSTSVLVDDQKDKFSFFFITVTV